MGYTHETDMAAFVAPGKIAKSAGTWTATLASNTVGDVRTAAGAAFNLFVPMNPPLGNAVAVKGARVKSVELLYMVATAVLVSVTTVEVEKMVITSAGVASGAALPSTLNVAENSSAKRLAVASHRLIVSITDPAWIDNNTGLWLYVSFDPGATSIFTLWGAVVNYDLRL